MHSRVWDGIAALKPRLPPHVRLHRQTFRGRRWYVLQDAAGARFHRFTPVAHYLMSSMDGQRSLQEIWQRALEYWGDHGPSQDDVIKLLGQLYSNDLLICDLAVDQRSLLDRAEQREGRALRQKLMAPLAIRLPLLDLDAFLGRTLKYLKPLYSRTGFCVWLLLVLSGLMSAGMHWSVLTGDLADRVFSPGNLLIMFCLYPLIKLFHELGHAYAVKRWGGEVHDLGLMFLVFVPVPYVDATAASAFRNKHKRMLVGAAGIMVELALASVAMLLWTQMEPGFARSLAFNSMLIGGVSTLFFNGNPLLRFDGYYVFSDALEMPNLASRSTQYLGFLVQRYLLHSPHAIAPQASAGEKRWFVFYGLAAFIYRLFIMAAIVLFVAGKWFFIGVILALWAVNAMLVLPLYRKLRFLFLSPVFMANRSQAVLRSGAYLVLLVGLLGFVQVPSYTTTEGVVWLAEKAEVRAQSDGFVKRVLLNSGQEAERNQALIELSDPLLSTHEEVLQYKLRELDAQFQMELLSSPAQAQITQARRQTVIAQLTRVHERQAGLVIRSPGDGSLALLAEKQLPERFFRQGDLLGYVTKYPITRVMAVVEQDYIGQLRRSVKAVELRLSHDLSQVWPAEVLRIVPASTHQLPSPALGEAGGGQIALDPEGRAPDLAFRPVFWMELSLPVEAAANYMGERVFVRIHHGGEPLGLQAWRALRRVFLERFNV